MLAARKLGMDSVPVIELAHMSEAEKRAYVIADNKLALNAGWDEELLALELGDLKAFDFDLGLTGFAPGELDALLGAGRQGNTTTTTRPRRQRIRSAGRATCGSWASIACSAATPPCKRIWLA